MRGKGPKKLTRFFPEEISRSLHRDLGQIYRLYPLWTDAVGADLALHSQPTGYAGGCLTVQVDTPVWATVLRQQQRSIIARLVESEDLRQLKDLRVRISPTQTPTGPTATVRRAPQSVSSTSAEAISRTAEAIEDPELKAALKRLQKSTSPTK